MSADDKSVRIIPATSTSLSHAARLATRSWPVRPDQYKLLEQLKKPGTKTLIAVPLDDDFPVMGVTVATIKGSLAMLRETVVAVPFTGKGLGRALLDAMLNHVMLLGVHEVVARVAKMSRGGCSFFESYGFEVIHTEEAKDAEGFKDGQSILTLRYVLPW